MKKAVGMLVILAISSAVCAADRPPEQVLDKVGFQVSAKQWVSTQTALLTVNINATLNNADLVRARADIMSSLLKVAQGEWHLIQFERSQDSSGLEKLFVQAQVRVPQNNLTNIYKNAKSVSKPGANYEIGTIEFKAGLEEIQQIKAQLRERLYQQVQDELARMNKVYNYQHYSVNSLVFIDGEAAPQAKTYQPRSMNVMAMTAAGAPALTVSNELIMSALVEAASNRSGEK